MKPTLMTLHKSEPQGDVRSLPHSQMIPSNSDKKEYKEIDIGHGLKTIVDAEDYDLLMQYKWGVIFNKNSDVCYAKRAVWNKGKVLTVRMHRMIVNAPKGMVVDHINHNTLDNRKNNLRVVRQADNVRNAKRSVTNNSGYCGVYSKENKFQTVWKANINFNNKTYHLGTFKSKEEAILARTKANIKYGFHENHGI